MLENNLSNDKSLEVYVVISQKNLCCTIFNKKTDKKQNERKSRELTVCNLYSQNFHTQNSKTLNEFLAFFTAFNFLRDTYFMQKSIGNLLKNFLKPAMFCHLAVLIQLRGEVKAITQGTCKTERIQEFLYWQQVFEYQKSFHF